MKPRTLKWHLLLVAERPRVLRLHTDLKIALPLSRRTNVVKRDSTSSSMARRFTLRLIANIWRRPIAATMSVLGDRGRSTDKLQKVRPTSAPDDLPLVKADAAEPASCVSMSSVPP